MKSSWFIFLICVILLLNSCTNTSLDDEQNVTNLNDTQGVFGIVTVGAVGCGILHWMDLFVLMM